MNELKRNCRELAPAELAMCIVELLTRVAMPSSVAIHRFLALHRLQAVACFG